MKTSSLLLFGLSALMVVPVQAGDHASSYAKMFVRKYDSNDDGKLNADEYPEKYREYFGKTDRNQDGYVNQIELREQIIELRSEWKKRTEQRIKEERAAKAKRLIDQVFKADANGDGRLNADESASVIHNSFGLVDTNHDGYLSRSEVENTYGIKTSSEPIAQETSVSTNTELQTIVETAINAGSFETLVTAVQQADLVDALSGDGRVTVFAPTDEAFAKLPEDVLQAILADKEKLQAVLKYHVVPGSLLAQDVTKMESAESLLGQSLNISVKGNNVRIENAQILKTDIACSNGVIHVIDNVMLPNFFETVQPETTQAAQTGELLDVGSDNISKRWMTVNDGVMGGVSEGNVRLTDNNTIEFYGNLSLRNNGGFASVRSKPQEFNLQKDDTLVVRVRGDGRAYYLNLYAPSFRTAFSFRAPVQTTDGQWEEVRIPLSDFYATSFGRKVRNAKLDPAKINSIGFLLADKKEGSFLLEFDSIRVER